MSKVTVEEVGGLADLSEFGVAEGLLDDNVQQVVAHLAAPGFEIVLHNKKGFCLWPDYQGVFRVAVLHIERDVFIRVDLREHKDVLTRADMQSEG